MHHLFKTCLALLGLALFCTVSAHEIGYLHHRENQFAMPVKRKDIHPRHTSLHVQVARADVASVRYQLFDGTLLGESEAPSADFGAVVAFPHEGLFEVTALGFDADGNQVAKTYATLHIAERRLANQPLEAALPVTPQKGFMAPLWSPSGEHLVFSGEQYRGLYLVNMNTRAKKGFSITTLSEQDMAGYKPQWHPHEQGLWFRDQGQTDSETPANEIDLGGNSFARDKQEREAAAEPTRFNMVNDELFLTVRDGQTLKRPIALTNGGDKFFGPQGSPDGTKVLYEGLTSGLHVLDLESGQRIHIGQGNHPSWGPDSTRIFFDISEDGHYHIINSDLFVYDLNTNTTTQLTNTPDQREQRPAVANDGRHIAYDADGAVFVAVLPQGGE
ncbi:TolB family protein [Acanthopleuribacter pedis]|uniref:Uncharacterized protein n=1 Tax=Acanthopleuribacter pedis TaxID=442870 RepID=A0A8J7Q552_9BACT|nr:hypothetical protein [Acanthopleuribacter pedis]MBO1319245.1 hypothetical protein [Acanthopleuribacter pedis]